MRTRRDRDCRAGASDLTLMLARNESEPDLPLMWSFSPLCRRLHMQHVLQGAVLLLLSIGATSDSLIGMNGVRETISCAVGYRHSHKAMTKQHSTFVCGGVGSNGLQWLMDS